MSSLTFTDKKLFEKLFDMDSGYLLDFSNSSLQEFLNDYEIDLGNNKYDKYGSSKAKRVRAFWEIEDDNIVSKVLNGLLEYANHTTDISVKDNELAKNILNRLMKNEEYRNQEQELSVVEENILNHRIWGNEKIRIFLSHKSEVMKETGKLKKELSFYGVSCFVAHKDIEPTRLWQDEIENALYSMDILVAIMTDDFKNSNWTDQEIGFAMGRKKPIISLRMGTDPYGFIGKYQGIKTSWENASFEIIKILMVQEKMVDTYLEKLEICATYDDANKLAECLPYIKTITQAQINIFIKIFEENSQIRDSHGFDGLKPSEFGKGLAFHLSRATGDNYKISSSHKIIKV